MTFDLAAAAGDPTEGATLPPVLTQCENSDRLRIAMASWLIWSFEMRPILANINLKGEPAWGLLLDLYIRQKQNQRTLMSSAYLSNSGSDTTSYRKIVALFDYGWAERKRDLRDKRRSYVSLRPKAMARLDRHLDLLVASLSGAKPIGTEAIEFGFSTIFTKDTNILENS